MAAVPVAVILLMPDLGSVMVLGAIVLGVLLSSGASNRWILGLLGTGVVGCVAVWQLGLLDDYQIARFAAFANPSLDPAGVGYNTNQARIAIGGGGLTGSGLFHGSQTTGQFVPEQQTDFIFTVAGEELGFLGAGLIIVLLGVVLWRACRIARETTELYGTVVAAGIIAWFAFQSFENIGMTLGIMPVTGLPLPVRLLRRHLHVRRLDRDRAAPVDPGATPGVGVPLRLRVGRLRGLTSRSRGARGAQLEPQGGGAGAARGGGVPQSSASLPDSSSPCPALRVRAGGAGCAGMRPAPRRGR